MAFNIKDLPSKIIQVFTGKAAGGARASEIQAAIIVTAFGFALVSLPLALTEMQKGRSPQNTR